MVNLKEQKEQFVTGLAGGSIVEVYGVTGVALTAYFAYSVIGKFYGASLLLDFLINVVAILCSVTTYSDQYPTLHLFILVPALFVLGSNKKKGKTVKREEDALPKKPFVTAYRSVMIILTTICILAVDFRIFPRRFAKVETWGASMMDLGVGSFVFSMGLVNARSFLKGLALSNYKFSMAAYLGLIKKSIIKASPILVLGVIRLVSVKSLEYQEHVTEYGIHWNFFITLGLLPITLAILDPILNWVPRAAVAFTISLGYEIALQNGVLEFILRSDNRLDNIITMNKEGIFSFFGYVSIFVFGQSVGVYTLTRDRKKNTLFSLDTIRSLATGSIVYQAIFLLLLTFHTGISRRLANLIYVIWVVSFNVTNLLAFAIIDFYIGGQSELFAAINNNGLLIFLISNLLTGLVNMMSDTLAASNLTAFLIMLGYCLTVCAIAVVLNRRNIFIKL